MDTNDHVIENSSWIDRDVDPDDEHGAQGLM